MNRNSILVLALVCWVAAVSAQPVQHMSIEELRALELPDVHIESLEAVVPQREDSKSVAHVVVKGKIGGTIGFELLLPEVWNRRFVMGGGGGFSGVIQNAARNTVLSGYATVGTDTGHQWPTGYLAGWAQDNIEGQLNFGYLAVHRTATVAKAIIAAYYGQKPTYSYFIGCSRGGGQAMMEAQRFPEDFDGIVAGAPAFDWTGFAASMIAIAQALYPNPDKLDSTVLDKAAIDALSAAIIEQCDAQDGVEDGIVADPSRVVFDLAKVPGLKDAQRAAIEAIYAGALNDTGRIQHGFPRGAEVVADQWIAWLVGPVPPMLEKDGVPNLTFAFGTQIFKHLVFNDPDWNYATYDFSTFAEDTRLAASFLNATNPNLDGLKVRNGKLILWHGWADTALFAQATIDYYEKVQAHDPNAADYCRLFLVPGCLHCGGGPGVSEVDWLGVLVDWVEHGKAPDRIVASRSEKGQVVMTRPLYPYPAIAEYDGSGNPNLADSFVQTMPTE